jgi:hypothetical protein
MSTIKVQFRKEVDVDLNTYYPSFPRKLREEIDNALYGLLGGQKPPIPRRTLKATDSFRRLPKQCGRINSNYAKLLNQLNVAAIYSRDELVVAMEKAGVEASGLIANLVRDGYLELVT